MRALNSSGVLDETTEEGRLFQTGIVLGKNEFFRASICKVSGVLKFVRCPGSSVWSRGQVLIFAKRHCTGVNLVEEGQGRRLPTGLQGWPLKFVQHIADTTCTCISPSPAGPSGSCTLHLLHQCYLSVMIGMPNRSCILELRSNQCLVCNFLSVPRCQCQVVRRKPIVLVAFHEISETC